MAKKPNNEIPRSGDWYCPNCRDLQFARNQQCRQCGTPKPSGAEISFNGSGPAPLSTNNQAMMSGDWICPACGDLVFARNTSCRRCKAEKPPDGALGMPAEATGMPPPGMHPEQMQQWQQWHAMYAQYGYPPWAYQYGYPGMEGYDDSRDSDSSDSSSSDSSSTTQQKKKRRRREKKTKRKRKRVEKESGSDDENCENGSKEGSDLPKAKSDRKERATQRRGRKRKAKETNKIKVRKSGTKKKVTRKGRKERRRKPRRTASRSKSNNQSRSKSKAAKSSQSSKKSSSPARSGGDDEM